jgi:hypothetical protein
MDNTAGPPAIETTYAGCRFRSRLEARWAVFFDALGIKWEYEPQGYVIDVPGQGAIPYLPDFWLPDSTAWAEVKGNQDLANRALLASAARQLPGARWLLLLGNIPQVRAGWWVGHHHLWFGEDEYALDKGPRYWQSLYWFTETGLDFFRASCMDLGDAQHPRTDAGPSYWRFDAFVDPEAAGVPGATTLAIAAAYAAARSARFEHGQSGPYRGAR